MSSARVRVPGCAPWSFARGERSFAEAGAIMLEPSAATATLPTKGRAFDWPNEIRTSWNEASPTCGRSTQYSSANCFPPCEETGCRPRKSKRCFKGSTKKRTPFWKGTTTSFMLPNCLRAFGHSLPEKGKGSIAAGVDGGLGHAGSTILRCFAASRMWAIREGGMPDLRQWLTVDGDASSASASLVMLPKAATTLSYSVCICDTMR